jgi:hypothetical protein
MDPHGGSVPGWGFECAHPRGNNRLTVYHATRRLNCFSRDGIKFAEWLTPTPRRSEGVYLT